MFKKITLAIVALSVVALAESPVKVTVEFDKEVAIEILKDWGSKAKDLGAKGLDKAKEATTKLIEDAKTEREANIKVEVEVKKKGIRI